MINSINEYKLNTEINLYKDALSAFGKLSYKWGIKAGIKRIYKYEKFYRIKNDWFLGSKAEIAYASAINDKICKIYFKMDSTMAVTHGIGSLEEDRKKVYEFVYNTMGKHTYAIHSSFIWVTEGGSVVINHTLLSTELILMSRSLKNAKRLTFIDKFIQNVFL